MCVGVGVHVRVWICLGCVDVGVSVHGCMCGYVCLSVSVSVCVGVCVGVYVCLWSV